MALGLAEGAAPVSAHVLQARRPGVRGAALLRPPNPLRRSFLVYLGFRVEGLGFRVLGERFRVRVEENFGRGNPAF